MPTPPPLPTFSLLPNELARNVSGQLHLRPDAVRARWNLADLITADNHRLRGSFTCNLKPSADPADRKLLAETFLSRKVTASVDDAIAHFAPTLQSAAATVSSTQPVADWLNGSKEALVDALRKAADRAGFAAGLEVLPPFQLDLESPSFQQQRLEAMERNLAQQRVEGQVQHFEKAAALLKQFDALRQAAPGISPGAILQQISPTDQGTMLQTLLLAAGKGAAQKQLWAVAGPTLVRIDPRATASAAQATQLINLPQTLGPLRSVQPAERDGQDVLLIGARAGVMIVNVAAPDADPELYNDADVVSQLGFNRTVLWRHALWACHADAGVVGWDLGVTARPKAVYRPAQFGVVAPASLPSVAATGASMVSMEGPRAAGARNLTAIDDQRLIFSVGPRLFTIDAEGRLESIPGDARADVVSLIPEADHLFVIYDDGTVQTRDRQSLAVTADQRRGSRTLAAARMPWLGSARLLLATDSGPIVCLGTDDPLVTEYCSTHRGLRHLAATHDAIAAMSADRQRVLVWNPWDPRKPAAEISVASLARHRVGDVTFA